LKPLSELHPPNSFRRHESDARRVAALPQRPDPELYPRIGPDATFLEDLL
jgi:hypothetical protein